MSKSCKAISAHLVCLRPSERFSRFCSALTLVDVFAILKSLARYPSGPRERSAKPPFVGSNPTRAPSFSFQINGLQLSFLPRHPQLGNIWEQLEKEPLLDSRLRAGACLELHGCRSSAWFRRWHVPIAAERSWRVRRYRAGPKRECGEVDATSRAQALPPLQPASARVLEDYIRGAVRPTGSGRVSLPHSI